MLITKRYFTGDSTIGCPKHNSKNSKLALKYRSSWLFSCRVSGQDERWPCSTQTPSHLTLQTVWDRLPLNRTNTEKWRAQTVTVSRAARRRVIRRVSEVVTSAAVKMRWGQRRHVVMIWRVKVWSVRKVNVHAVMNLWCVNEIVSHNAKFQKSYAHSVNMTYENLSE